jgi:hypothetical protein
LLKGKSISWGIFLLSSQEENAEHMSELSWHPLQLLNPPSPKKKKKRERERKTNLPNTEYRENLPFGLLLHW